MSNIFGTGDTKAMQNVIDAASKIMMGVQDEQTAAAQTEDDHPIVAAKKEEIAAESADLDSPEVEKSLKHDCATHVVHKEHGEGRCIPGMHSLEESTEGLGTVTQYDVMFTSDDGPFVVKDIDVNDLEIVQEMSHGHAKKKK
jgi:hypothetical protein